MAPDEPRDERAELDAAPPFATWPRIYALVVGVLVAQVIVYTIVTSICR